MNRKIEIAFAITIIMLVGSVMVPAMMQKPTGRGPYKAIPDSSTTPANQTLLYEFTIYNNGSAITNSYFPFYFTNESLFAFNITNNVVQNVMFLYSNGSQIKGLIPTGQYGMPNTNQGSGKWIVYFYLSMPSHSSQNIYMQVYPYTTSVLNVNMSTTTYNSKPVLIPISFTNTGYNYVQVPTGIIPLNTTAGYASNIEFTSLSGTVYNTYLPGNQSTYTGLVTDALDTTGYMVFEPLSVSNIYVSDTTYYNFTANNATSVTVTTNNYGGGSATTSNTWFNMTQSDNSYTATVTYAGYVPGAILTGSIIKVIYSVTMDWDGLTSTSGSFIAGVYNGSAYTGATKSVSGVGSAYTWSGSYVMSLTGYTEAYAGLSMTGSFQGGTSNSYMDGYIQYQTVPNTANEYILNATVLHGQKSVGTATSITPTLSNSGNFVQFNETGLPYGQSWNVTVKNSSADVNQLYSSATNTLKAFLPTGHNYSFTFATANQEYYNIVNETGQVFLSSSSNASVNITLTNVSYFVNFKESRLLAGSSWTITLNGSSVSSTNNEISYLMRNGSYAWSVSVSSLYEVTPSSGTITVNGSAQTVNVVFTYKAFNITFSETGLPTGQAWSLTINGTVYNSVNGTVLFEGKTGTYSATINNASYYTPVNKYFNFTISGNAHYTIQYAVLVTFTETGYQGSWTISVNGQSYTSTTNTIVVKITPGYFTYYVTGISGYSISPIHNSNYYFTPQTIKIAFGKTTAPIWSIFVQPDIIALIVIVGVITGMWLVFRKK